MSTSSTSSTSTTLPASHSHMSTFNINVIINGSVATGKSYIQSLLISHFQSLNYSTSLFPEFIYNDPTALSLLSRRFHAPNPLISPLTFQNFILDKWEYTYQNQSRSQINIFERLPDDAVEVFSKLTLPPTLYNYHLERLQSLTLPKYSDFTPTNTIWIIYENSFNKSTVPLTDRLTSIISTISQNKTSPIRNIVVEVRSQTSYENYKYRNRSGEIYTPEQLEELYEIYLQYTQSKIAEINSRSLNGEKLEVISL